MTFSVNDDMRLAPEPLALAPLPIPDLRALLMGAIEEAMLTFNCHQIGTVQSFDSAKQTVTVTINVLRQVPDLSVQPPVYKSQPYPLLLDVPVFINSGGSGHLTFPITAGDTCLVLFNDRDIDNWFSTGNTTAPNTGRAHDLSDGLALVGFRSVANALASFDTNNAVLAYKNGKVLVADKLQLLNALTNMTTVLDKLKDALTALDAKTGPSAATQITTFQTEYQKLFQ